MTRFLIAGCFLYPPEQVLLKRVARFEQFWPAGLRAREEAPGGASQSVSEGDGSCVHGTAFQMLGGVGALSGECFVVHCALSAQCSEVH